MSASSTRASASSSATSSSASASAGSLARAGAKAIEATPARQLADPGPQRVVRAERVQPLVRPREDVLEDVVRLVGREPEALGRDRVDVAREPLDELAPGVLVARAAAGGQLGVGFLRSYADSQRS